MNVRTSHPQKDLSLHAFIENLEFYNAFIIPLLNQTKIGDFSFHQESIATKHYCLVDHFKSTILCQLFNPNITLLCPPGSVLAIAWCSGSRRNISVDITTPINELLISGSPHNEMVEHIGVYMLFECCFMADTRGDAGGLIREYVLRIPSVS